MTERLEEARWTSANRFIVVGGRLSRYLVRLGASGFKVRNLI